MHVWKLSMVCRLVYCNSLPGIICFFWEQVAHTGREILVLELFLHLHDFEAWIVSIFQCNHQPKRLEFKWQKMRVWLYWFKNCEQTACIVLFASVLNSTQHLNIQKHKPTHSSCKQNIAPKPSVWSYTHGEIQRKPAKECALAFPGSWNWENHQFWW
jgi:hypothetical protein